MQPTEGPRSRWYRHPATTICLLVVAFLALLDLNVWFASLPQVEFVANDISYYGYHLDAMLSGGGWDQMPEYPLPAVWILVLLYRLGGGWQTWEIPFAAVMIAVVAVVAVVLYRRNNPRATLFWLLFTGASGPILWFRFDLVPAVLVLLACVWLSSRPRVAGALVAVGAAVKLWPALLALPMAAPRPLTRGPGRSRLTAFLVAGVGLGLASLLVAGWDRSVAPLTWQGARGLQMESVPATPLMALRAFSNIGTWQVFLSDFNAIELSGSGVATMLRVSTALTAGALLLTGALTWRLLRRRDTAAAGLDRAILWSLLAVILALVVANKTLSPQYVSWLAGPVAALLLSDAPARERRDVTVQAVGLVVVAALTQYTYPWATHAIMADPPGGIETAALVLRNLALVGLLGHAATRAWGAGSDRRTPSGRLPANHSVSFTTEGSC